jgi:hypothetical protein
MQITTCQMEVKIQTWQIRLKPTCQLGEYVFFFPLLLTVPPLISKPIHSDTDTHNCLISFSDFE